MKNMTISARLFIGAMAMAGVAALVGGLMQWESKDPVRFLAFLVIALVGVAAIAATATCYEGWVTPLLVLPVMVATYFSFKRYFQQATIRMAKLQFAVADSAIRERAGVRD